MTSLDSAFLDTRHRPASDVVGKATGLMVNAVHEVRFDGTNYYRGDGLKLPQNIRELSLQGKGFKKGLYNGYYYRFIN